MTLNELECLKNIEINNCLIDMQKTNIDTQYCFMCGKTPVNVCFSSNGIKLGEKLKTYFLGLKRQN